MSKQTHPVKISFAAIAATFSFGVMAAEDKQDVIAPYGAIWIGAEYTNSEFSAKDISSRIGINGKYESDFAKGLSLIGKVEYGVKTVNGDDGSITVGTHGSTAYGDAGKDIFLRQGYIGVEGSLGSITLGKQWSTYYDVAGWTDWFLAGGGTAAGVYSSATDGGGTGSGRADKAFQLETKFLDDSVRVGFQYQADGVMPLPKYTAEYLVTTVDSPSYDSAYGISLTYKFSDFQVGVAHHITHLDMNVMDDQIQIFDANGVAIPAFIDANGVLTATDTGTKLTLADRMGLGEDNSGSATIAGMKFDDQRLIVALNVAYTDKHEIFTRSQTDLVDDGIGGTVSETRSTATFVETLGAEVYSDFKVNERYRTYAGLNYQELQGDSKQLMGQNVFQNFYILGVSYHFNPNRWGPQIFVQYQITDTYYGDDTADDVVTFGAYLPF